MISQGATLFPCWRWGFKFGEMDIFHRHEDLNGKGEVLFSMINMVKPGTFNPYRMEQFSTPGVSLFMQLPLRSNAAFAFEHMLQAADQLASDLDAMLTDARAARSATTTLPVIAMSWPPTRPAATDAPFGLSHEKCGTPVPHFHFCPRLIVPSHFETSS